MLFLWFPTPVADDACGEKRPKPRNHGLGFRLDATTENPRYSASPPVQCRWKSTTHAALSWGLSYVTPPIKATSEQGAVEVDCVCATSSYVPCNDVPLKLCNGPLTRRITSAVNPCRNVALVPCQPPRPLIIKQGVVLLRALFAGGAAMSATLRIATFAPLPSQSAIAIPDAPLPSK